jgi:hypothetical protein
MIGKKGVYERMIWFLEKSKPHFMKYTTDPFPMLNLCIKIVHSTQLPCINAERVKLRPGFRVTCDTFRPFQQTTDTATTCLPFAFDVIFGKVCYCVTTGRFYVFGFVVPLSASVRSALCRDARVITCHHCGLYSGALKCFCRGSTDRIWSLSFDVLSRHVIHVLLPLWNVTTFLFYYYYFFSVTICCIEFFWNNV